MLRDARGEPVSISNAPALQRFETALTQFQSYVGNPVETIETALAEEPDFALGHAFRATMLLLFSEKRYLSEARRSIEAAERLMGRANLRERGLIAAARRWVDGDWVGACRAWEHVLVGHPRDAFALQAAHLTDFFLGDSRNLRDRIARVLPYWSAGTPGYSYVLGMYAFGLEETNLYTEAEETGRRALDLEPRDGWAVHAVTHVMEMQGRYKEGIEWLSSRRQDWAPDNGFAYHNWWHLALYHMESGAHNQVLQLYDNEIYPAPSDVTLQMLDATALLWRLSLHDADVGNRWAPLADKWEEKAEIENGYYAFNDFHAMLAFAADGRERAAAKLLLDMEKAARADAGLNAMMTREVGLPACRAIRAFSHERYDEALELLIPVRAVAHRFGGSHAQRDVLDQTSAIAAIRAGRSRLAQNLVNERIARKPCSPLAWDLMTKALRAAGDQDLLKAAA